jgi:nitroimidazol reductase NimA-like FMN-containing flavoprotein (pyridoxamine 5'-phosphate oxidase superfamily)
MARAQHVAELVELDRTECLRLLATTQVGRLAVTLGGDRPMIRPLNYVFDERSQAVVFRTAPGSKLHALLRAKRAAFEIDAIDPPTRTGWSVIIDGVVEEVTNSIELDRLERLPLEVWPPGERGHWCRVRAWTVSGRRITAPPDLGTS